MATPPWRAKEVECRHIINLPFVVVFVSYSIHRLDFVNNGLNADFEVRKTIGTVKAIIKFFREKAKRRCPILNKPLLYETRQSAKYKSIGLWKNFIQFHILLECLAMQ